MSFTEFTNPENPGIQPIYDSYIQNCENIIFRPSDAMSKSPDIAAPKSPDAASNKSPDSTQLAPKPPPLDLSALAIDSPAMSPRAVPKSVMSDTESLREDFTAVNTPRTSPEPDPLKYRLV